jgi:hypothetical protein
LARIKKNDVLVDTYVVSSTVISSSGYEFPLFTRVNQNMGMDIQPISSKTNLAIFGLNTGPSGGKHVFYDSDKVLELGAFVKLLSTGVNFKVVGYYPWYNHKEAILEPYPGAIA